MMLDSEGAKSAYNGTSSRRDRLVSEDSNDVVTRPSGEDNSVFHRARRILGVGWVRASRSPKPWLGRGAGFRGRACASH